MRDTSAAETDVVPAFGTSTTGVRAGFEPGITATHRKATTSYLAQVSLVPGPDAHRITDQAAPGTEPRFALNDLWINEIVISDNDRPQTRFATQRSHTVAWTLLRRQMMNFGGRSLRSLCVYLGDQFTDLRALAATAPGKAADDDESVAALPGRMAELAALGSELTSAGTLPIHVWQPIIGNFIRSYVQAYQLSRMATFADGVATGNDEANSMQTLETADGRAKQGTAFKPEEIVAVVAAAGRLIDLKFGKSLSPDAYAHAVRHWAVTLLTTFPNLLKSHGDAILSPVFSKPLPAGVAKATVAGNVADLLHFYHLLGDQPYAAQTMLATMKGRIFKAGGAVDPSENVVSSGYPTDLTFRGLKSLSANFVASVEAHPIEDASPRSGTVDTGFETGGTTTTVFPTYDVRSMEIRRISLSDRDRPDTQFETQQSHTVPWTLIRAQIMSFGAKSLADLISHIGGKLAEFPASKDPEVTLLHDQATKAAHVAATERLPAHVWQKFAGDYVAAYMTLHQRAPSTTYVDSASGSRALGHGEPTHMATLQLAEREAANGVPALTSTKARLVQAATALLDIHSGESRLSADSGRTAVRLWAEAMSMTFAALWPLIAVDAWNAALAVPSPKDGQTVGAWTGLPPR